MLKVLSIAGLITLTGCMNGAKYLGVIPSADGVHYTHTWQTTTKGQSSPVITTQYEETCVNAQDPVPDETAVICSKMAITGQVYGEPRMGYYLPQAILGSSAAGAARLLRPDKFNSTTNQIGGGANATGGTGNSSASSASDSRSGAGSYSNSSSGASSNNTVSQSQDQFQHQDMNQHQNQSTTIQPRNPCI